jgi:hypothetical protein
MKLDWFKKIKHWHIFIAIVVTSFSAGFSPSFIIPYTLYLLIWVGWIFLVGYFIRSYASQNSGNLYPLLLAFISLLSLILIAISSNFGDNVKSSLYPMTQNLLLGIGGVALILLALNSAISIKKHEKNSMNIVFLILLMILIFFGVWVIQPTINKMNNKQH